MGCCESIMRAVLGGGSSGGNQEVEMPSKTAPTLSTTLRGKDIIVLQSEGRPSTISGDGLVLSCAPVEQVREARESGVYPRRPSCKSLRKEQNTAAVRAR